MKLVCVALTFGAAQEYAKREPMTFALCCAPGTHCPLLKGAPQTSGMRGTTPLISPGAKNRVRSKDCSWDRSGGDELLRKALR